LDTPHLSPCARAAGVTMETNSAKWTTAQEYFGDGSDIAILFSDSESMQFQKADRLKPVLH
jgi:hypothetical protein